jgi:integrase
MVVCYCGKRTALSTNLHIDRDLWDANTQRAKGNNLKMKMSEAQINYTLELLINAVDIVMRKFESLNIIPTIEQFKRSYDGLRFDVSLFSLGMPNLATSPVNPMPTTVPPYYQSMPYMPQLMQMQGSFQPNMYPQQPFYPSNGYPFQQQPERVIRENMEYSNPKWNRSTPTPNFNKDSELVSDEAGFSLKEEKTDIEDVSAHQKKPRRSIKRSNKKEPVDDGKEKDIFWALDQFVTVMGKQNEWTHATYQKFDALENHLKQFRQDQREKLKNKKFELSFSYFNEEGLLNYVDFLSKVKKMKNTSVDKQLDFLRWFFRWTLAKRFHDVNDFETFRPKLKKTRNRVVFLTKDELEKLKNYVAPEDRKNLERVRDVFLFQCCTGLRYSDVYNLRRCDVHEDYIDVTTIKTNDTLRIELNEESKGILERYANMTFENDKALPVISNQKMNDSLHELCRLAGINEMVRKTYFRGKERIDEVKPKWELIGTHTGRRTFICHALSMGIPPEIVMKWTGHSDYKAMKPYIDVVDEIKAESMKKFNGLFGKPNN